MLQDTNIKIKDLKYLYYQYRRNNFLTKLNNIKTNYIIKKDKVLLFVDNYELSKIGEKYYEYNLKFNNRNKLLKIINKTEFNHLMYYYKLNKKPFYYVIEGAKFKHKLRLETNNETIVIFKNCIFESEVELKNCQKIILENNKYYHHGTYSQLDSNLFLTISNVEKLKIINENFINSDYTNNPTPNFGVDITAKKIELINSFINVDKNTKRNENTQYTNKKESILIKSEEINFINSYMISPNIYIKSKKINFDEESKMIGSQGIIINNQKDIDNELLNKVETPYLIYNNKLVKNEGKIRPIFLIKTLSKTRKKDNK